MKKSIAIIGGGAAGLALAGFLDPTLFDVTIYEKNKTFGRKFLVAGKGGFNLTHSENITDLITRYHPYNFIEDAIHYFDNEDLRFWLKQIGIPTFIGSSKRIYPIEGIKPIEVLNKLLNLLKSNNVSFKFEQHWKGWNSQGQLIFESNNVINADYVVFATGGASWKVTGSDGSWLHTFKEMDIKTIPFKASNCAYKIEWAPIFLQKNSGSPLKNIALSCGSIYQKGELVITDFGLEGNAIYALSSEIQSQLNNTGNAFIYLDLKPQFSTEEILKRLKESSKKTTQILKERLKLSPAQIDLIKSILSKEEFLNNTILATSIKSLKLKVTASSEIDQAISTTGGISLNEINNNYMLKKKPNYYCIGEMLDWNAPTGGYLLQACFSMGAFLANHLNTNRLNN